MTRHHQELLRGFIPSLLLPIVFIFIFIELFYQGELNLHDVINGLFKSHHLSSLLAVGAMPNLILFFYAMNRERWQLGRGVVSATLLYGVAVMIMKLG